MNNIEAAIDAIKKPGAAIDACRILSEGITTNGGLLWHNGKIIELPMADIVAAVRGFHCAEQFVRHLESSK